MLYSTLTILACLQAVLGQKVLFKWTMDLSFYYDNSATPGAPDTCLAITTGVEKMYAEAAINYGACGGRTYRGRGDNRMVAIGAVYAKTYCGKHIRITSPEGKPVQIDGKDFYIKDVCPGCGSLIKQLFPECGQRTSLGGLVKPWGYTVELLDSDEPGAGLNTLTIPDGTPVTPAELAGNLPGNLPGVGGGAPAPVVPVTPPPAAVGGCVCRKKGDEGCLNGSRLLCNEIDGVDQTKVAWAPVGGQCQVTCARKRGARLLTE
ncbi:uncharacterized protein MKK02DRAFT_29208 [Dioszegia hungarica]|uniref:Uncharacterized protein n=1 Tax=Dioszegia hungarica TaxID=4972 RepID=A0AA38HEJ1_9TREE|nr:uncharacterized protein MKK02DRAFT_29208 [Dioszegia hungarica]KAI9639070.1 hypothetical protein MKK02DRAFT_29208 [Dioszegia hungarica]